MSELEAGKLVPLDVPWRRPRPPRRRSAGSPSLSNAWYELRKSRTASIGAVMLVLLFGACIATPWIATHDPIKQSYRERLNPPRRSICWEPIAWVATSTRACCGAAGAW